jgi:hypothetical protein
MTGRHILLEEVDTGMSLLWDNANHHVKVHFTRRFGGSYPHVKNPLTFSHNHEEYQCTRVLECTRDPK